VTSIDLSAVKAFGQIAGIGGLSLFVFAYLFREVIRKRIFPQLSRDHAYQIIRLFMVLVFLLSMSGLGAWVYVDKGRSPTTTPPIVPTQDVGQSIVEWLTFVDGARYEEAWQSMPKISQARLTKQAFVELFATQRGFKGKVLSREPYSSNSISSPPGYPPGEYEVRTFTTQFEDGSKNIETIMAQGTLDGWRVTSHTISPSYP
jgi:hypothetical protein